MTPPRALFLDAWTIDQATGQVNKQIIGHPYHPDPAGLARFQADALGRTLAWAKARSRFYSHGLSGIDPREIRTRSDLSALPFTRPADLGAGGPRFACLSQGEADRIFTLETSGTTARPKRLFFTRAELMETRDFFRAILATLMAPGHTGLIFVPGATPLSAGDLIRDAMENAGARPLVHGPVIAVPPAMDAILDYRPSLVIGMPVQILALGEALADSGRDVPGIPFIILTADYVSPALARRVEQLFRCRVLSHYGLTETGFGGAIQCPCQEGLHIRHPHLLVEIVDPETGTALPPGHWGEIVLTTLDRQAMPLIRYRTGDMSRLLDRPCACGSPFARLDRVKNRQAQTIRPDQQAPLAMADLDDVLFAIPGVVDFTAAISAGSTVPRLDITLETKETAAAGQAVAALENAPALRKALDTGGLDLGRIRTRAFTLKNTYLGKRLIRDNRIPQPPARKEGPHEVL
ncbi:MAG: DVU_1553 family AMP-dependent CoA ligase [Desulfobacter sp.]